MPNSQRAKPVNTVLEELKLQNKSKDRKITELAKKVKELEAEHTIEIKEVVNHPANNQIIANKPKKYPITKREAETIMAGEKSYAKGKGVPMINSLHSKTAEYIASVALLGADGVSDSNALDGAMGVQLTVESHDVRDNLAVTSDTTGTPGHNLTILCPSVINNINTSCGQDLTFTEEPWILDLSGLQATNNNGSINASYVKRMFHNQANTHGVQWGRLDNQVGGVTCDFGHKFSSNPDNLNQGDIQLNLPAGADSDATFRIIFSLAGVAVQSLTVSASGPNLPVTAAFDLVQVFRVDLEAEEVPELTSLLYVPPPAAGYNVTLLGTKNYECLEAFPLSNVETYFEAGGNSQCRLLKQNVLFNANESSLNNAGRVVACMAVEDVAINSGDRNWGGAITRQRKYKKIQASKYGIYGYTIPNVAVPKQHQRWFDPNRPVLEGVKQNVLWFFFDQSGNIAGGPVPPKTYPIAIHTTNQIEFRNTKQIAEQQDDVASPIDKAAALAYLYTIYAFEENPTHSQSIASKLKSFFKEAPKKIWDFTEDAVSQASRILGAVLPVAEQIAPYAAMLI